VLLGGRKIESKFGFSIWSGPNRGVTELDGGSSVVLVVTFSLSGLPGGVSYVIVRVVKSTTLNM
jgi:hypothetical protein